MKEYVEDILYCLKLSIYFFIIPFAIGAIIGLILHGVDKMQIIIWGCRVMQYLGCAGLALAGISFVKTDLMRPLNYQREWETYFKKLNLPFVILIISSVIIAIAFIIQDIIR